MPSWFTLWWAMAGLVGLVWIVRLMAIGPALRRRQVLSARSYDGPPIDAPRISVLVAASNEEENIEACVTTLLEQDYPDFEVVVIDDRSADRTPSILGRLQALWGEKLRIVTVESLRDGWFGKNNAMREGAAAASGDWLCFTDADCRQTSRNTLSTAMHEASAHEVSFLSITPILETRAVWERIIQPVCALILIVWFLPERVNDPTRRTAYANGAFMLMTRRCYEKIGGHECVRTEVNEDIRMAALAKQGGERLRVVENDDLYVTRMYRSPLEAWQGWSRIFFGCLRPWPRLLAAASFVAVFSILPGVSLGTALIGRGLADADAASTWTLSICTWAGVVLLAQIVTWRFYGVLKVGRWWSLAYMIGAVVALGMLVNAGFKAAGVTTTTWRGTTYRGHRLEGRDNRRKDDRHARRNSLREENTLGYDGDAR